MDFSMRLSSQGEEVFGEEETILVLGIFCRLLISANTAAAAKSSILPEFFQTRNRTDSTTHRSNKSAHDP